MDENRPPLRERLGSIPALRALHYRDFRLLWMGAFLSFTGSQIQGVAQQDVVWSMTHSPVQLANVSFAMMAPISVLSPILGVAADMFDKKRLLVACMILCAVGPLLLAIAEYQHFLRYWMFIVVAATLGTVSCVEVQTRQSVVRAVVEEKDLAAAIPMQASTFNLARVIGPSIAGFVIGAFGPSMCFLLNGLSFFALAIAAMAIRADLRPISKRVEPIRDLVAEGFRHTFRTPSLRTLFLMESATAVFGTFYISQMAAIAKKQLGVGTTHCFTAVGVGALLGLALTASLSARPYKSLLVRLSMVGMSLSVFALAFTHSPILAYLLFAFLGAFSIAQFNTTNTLFQLLSPANLRGRVVSMHIWAIGGIAPLGVLGFGYISEWFGVPASLISGGLCLSAVTVWAWIERKAVVEPVL